MSMNQKNAPSVGTDSKPAPVWARGPSSAAPSTAASPNPSRSNTPSHPSSGLAETSAGENAIPHGPSAIPIGASHSRKSSLLVGAGGVDFKKSNIAFGTVNVPNSILSSSPAAPSTTGGHLADSVKSFGTIDADGNTDPSVVKTRKPSTLNPSAPSSDKQQLNVHSLFTSRSPQNPSSLASMSPHQMSQHPVSHIRRQSLGQSNPNFQGQVPIGSPNSSAVPPHLRPSSGMPGQSRPPNLNMPHGQFIPQHVQQGFRPQQSMPPHQPSVRPNGAGPQGMPRPMMNPGQYNMHSGPQGQYSVMNYPPPQGNFFPSYNPYEQPPNFVASQWAPQQHQQYNNGFSAGHMSPRPPQGQLAPAQAQSPMPTPATMISSGGPSPMPTPPTHPPSLISHQPTPSNVSVTSIPSTPGRPVPATAPSAQFLSGGAPSFTPRGASKTIKLSREDGREVDLQTIAKAVKPGPGATGDGVPDKPVTNVETLKKKTGLPVVVRLESEESKKARLAEEERQAKIKATEEKEASERKERSEKKAKEEQRIKTEADAKMKDVVEQDERERNAEEDGEKKKVDEAFAAEQAAERKLAEEKEAAVKAAQENSEKAEEERAAAHVASQEAREKAQEQRHALLSTPAVSVSVSPISTPVLVAGLPAKPIAAIAEIKRAPPSALDLSPSSPSIGGETTSVSATVLNSARPIEDINAITYPISLKSPKPELNANAVPGKFRYDRDFLMQFMNVCREKPESLPPLEEIGLEAMDTGSGFGSRRGGRASMGPSSRVPSGSGSGLAHGGSNRPFPGQGMGAFGMGSFGSGSGLSRATSEQRYQASRRASSQNGPTGMSPMAGPPALALSNSRSGTNRGSQRGSKRAPPGQTPAAAPIPISENAWTRTRLGGDAEGTPGYIERKVKALLNKLTEEKFDEISLQILEWANKSRNETNGLTLKLVIKQIFEKATDEAHWSSMYAKLCRLLHDELDPKVTEIIGEKPVSGRTLFRKYLLGRCQMDFENGWKAREDTAVAAAAKQKEDGEKQEKAKESGDKEADLMSDEYYAAQKAKRRGLGLVQLIGELFKREILSSRVISECLIKLLSNVLDPDEEDIESACKLLATVGSAYDRVASDNLNKAYIRLDEILKLESMSSRIRFMIMDVIDLRKEGWRLRKPQAGVMTIAEIHKQNAQEKSAAAAAVVAKESISRGGSRAGRDRRDGGLQPGEWQAVQSGARTLSRPTDFSGMGKNMSASGNAPSFGPSSVFASRKGKGNTAGMTTPPISRQPSSANMFSALNDAHEAEAAGGDGGEPGAQRKRLNLAPRTKPIPGGEGEMEVEAEVEVEGEGVGESGGGEGTEEMSEERAKAKIDVDMKELWGEKDLGGSRNPVDIVEYFVSLPESRRPLLAERLVSDIFRISKTKEAQIVAQGWRMALDQQSVTVDVLRQSLEGRMATLDDEAIDFPGAYSAVAYLVRGIDLSQEDVEGLGEKIEMEGTPLITPKQKLEKALTKVDEEAST
nr:translation initiation factor 4G [Cryptococcus depauperatus CBS 7855]